MNETRLSSAMTFFNKFIFPVLLLGIWSVGARALWRVQERGYPADLLLIGWLVLTAALCLGLAVCWVMAFPLKQVTLTADGLRVSNFVAEDFVPFADIVRVREWKLTRMRDITLVLHRPCRFGTRIRFNPTQTPGLRLGDHPVATLLRERAGLGEGPR